MRSDFTEMPTVKRVWCKLELLQRMQDIDTEIKESQCRGASEIPSFFRVHFRAAHSNA